MVYTNVLSCFCRGGKPGKEVVLAAVCVQLGLVNGRGRHVSLHTRELPTHNMTQEHVETLFAMRIAGTGSPLASMTLSLRSACH